MESQYIVWLEKQGIPLYKGGGIYWRLYQKALIPAQAHPCFIEITEDEAKKLLKESGAWFLRYTNNPMMTDSNWWYIICDFFDSKNLTSKMRNQIKKGNSQCTVKQVKVKWLAENGYECYKNAYERYSYASPLSEKAFRNDVLSSINGPFEYWGVFYDEKLVGYCQCIVDGLNIITSVIKYDPDYLQYYTSYALISNLINYYVVERGSVLSNGARSIVHDTNMQEYLLKFGFRKQYCHLKLNYTPWLKFLINITFPFRKKISLLPESNLINKVKALLFQEEIRRGENV